MQKLHETRIGLCGTSMINEELEQRPLKAFKEAISNDVDRFKEIIEMTNEVRDRKIGGEELISWFKESNKRKIQNYMELTMSSLNLLKDISFTELLGKVKMRSPARFMQ